MNVLLDTCVLSEFTRRKPDENVIRWVDGIKEENLHLSVITIGELQHGIERLPDSPRKVELMAWMKDRLLERFRGRIVAIDTQTMFLWGSLVTRLEQSGRLLPVMDSLIAATALQHHLVIATRNVSDFSPSGVSLVNPWERERG